MPYKIVQIRDELVAAEMISTICWDSAGLVQGDPAMASCVLIIANNTVENAIFRMA